jgi:nucleotide-binding universal stress UspA family protein
MNYKDLLVYLDESKSCDNRINAAIELAQTYEAHLTGLCAVVEPQLPGYVKATMFADMLAQQEEQARKRAEELAEKFTQKVRDAGLTVDCRMQRCLEPDLPRLIWTHTRYADLVVFGQPDPAEELPGGVHLPAEVALSAGRPALIVPYIGTRTTLGEHVMVAWDAGRESSRAVNDALPILEKARSVVVLVVDPTSGSGGHEEQPGADIALHLARHGCKVEAQHVESGDISVGDMILSRLADQSTDLLVMGAYGHARLRELILGGVTQHIMKHMTVPMLMSH